MTRTNLHSALAAVLLLGAAFLFSCNNNGNAGVAVATSDDSTTIAATSSSDSDSSAKAPADDSDTPAASQAAAATVDDGTIYTRANILGYYDSEDGWRFTFDEDGTGSMGRVGSLNFTDYNYRVKVNEIILDFGGGDESRLVILKDARKLMDPKDGTVYERQ